MDSSFQKLVVPENYLRKLLPAVRSGRSLLLFGPPGNGKTTLATRVAKLFKDTVYIPYAIEVAGQIIKVFDPTLHKPKEPEEKTSSPPSISLQRSGSDERWVPCARPVGAKDFVDPPGLTVIFEEADPEFDDLVAIGVDAGGFHIHNAGNEL
jgi:energy-coupling factor transporter ATP-binding protein EcfA2